MIKKVLFLYANQKGKNSLGLCEPVFRAILRKFRVTPLFNSMQIDISLSCRNSITEFFTETAPKYDAIFLFSEKATAKDEEILLREILSSSVTEHHICGKVVVFPTSEFKVEEKDGVITESYTYSSLSTEKAIETAFKLAGKKKHKVTLTGAGIESSSNPFARKFEEVSAKEPHISTECIPLCEMLDICINTHPTFDVVLSSTLSAEIIVSHLGASKNFSDSYLVCHSESGRVYCRKTSPYEEYDNSAIFSNVLAFSALLESVDMKSASDWLRRCASLSFEQFKGAKAEEFTDRIISEIKKPMRTKR